jgi:hypothetical protein
MAVYKGRAKKTTFSAIIKKCIKSKNLKNLEQFDF